jgi:hypothetical protein
MKNLGKVLIGIGLYFASRNIIFLILNVFRFIFYKIHIRFPANIHIVADKIFGGFLPYWVLSYGAIVFLIGGFILLIKINESITEKKYFNIQVIIGVLFGIIVNISKIWAFLPRPRSIESFLLINSFQLLLRVLPLVIIFIGFKKLLELNDKNTFKEKENISHNQSLSELKLETKFYGSVIEIFIFCIWMPILLVITLGFGFPFIICTLLRWICDKSIINGKHYKFKGTAAGLFGNYIVWTILSMITIGIYGFWATRNYIRWVVENIEMID